MTAPWYRQKNITEIAASLRTALGFGTAADQDVEDFATPDDLSALETSVNDAIAAIEEDVAAISGASDPWALQPVGALIALDMGEGVTPPPTNQSYRYIELTAGLTGAGGYNEGVLSSESVSGSAPTINATAVVSLSGSPLNGQTVRLVNTERRFLRPGSAGTLEDSANLAHTHTFTTSEGGAHTHTVLGTVYVGTGAFGGSSFAGYVNGTATTSSNGAHSHSGTTDAAGGTESRPRNIGVKYYRRIK